VGGKVRIQEKAMQDGHEKRKEKTNKKENGMIVAPKNTSDQEKSNLGKPNTLLFVAGKELTDERIIGHAWAGTMLGKPNLQRCRLTR
jgi:hypothetical protein